MTATMGKRIRYDRMIVNDDYRTPVPPDDPKPWHYVLAAVVVVLIVWSLVCR